MTDPTKTITEVNIDGDVYRLCFDFEAIAEAEDITGKALITGLQPKYVETPPINFVRAMFFASAKSLHPELTYEKAKTLINRKNLGDVWVKTLQAWFESSAEPEPEEVREAAAPANPTEDQR